MEQKCEKEKSKWTAISGIFALKKSLRPVFYINAKNK